MEQNTYYQCNICGNDFNPSKGEGTATHLGQLCNVCYYHVYQDGDDFDPLHDDPDAEEEFFYRDYDWEETWADRWIGEEGGI